ncbi:MAG TPA: cupin domain-containing protein [Anaeromyxobacteraceae bacterium]|nr:cupin domain-containing protein [Anaeromyxobacteraceae bacterium]
MKVVRSAEAPWADAISRGSFGQRRKPLGGEKLTCGLWELPPGKRSFPLHAHLVTEEAMFVISGRGKVRTPDGMTEVGPGDHVSFPAGGPAHQLVNDGAEPLVYLGMSAVFGADVVEYPDSDKVAASVGAWPKAKRFIFRRSDEVDYFAGEPGT